MKQYDIGLDLGTTSIIIATQEQGVVFHQPSIGAVDTRSSTILAVGDKALRMVGRVPSYIDIIRPLRDGIIQDHRMTNELIVRFINEVCRSRIIKPRVSVCVPAAITGIEADAVVEAVMAAGARQVFLVDEPVAAALGAGLDIRKPMGCMVIDIGGGTTDIAILSLGGVVVDSSIRVGGDAFDEAIVRYVKKVYNVLIGEPTAEKIKMNVATVLSNGKCTDMEVQGRDLIAGRPTTIKVTSADARAALREPVYSIIGTIRGVLEKCPPELSADIVDKGMVLTGGGALVDGLAQLLTEETGIKTTVAENPLDCVALGTGKALSELNNLRPGSVVGND